MWDVKRKVVVWKKLQTGNKKWRPLCFSGDGQTLAMTEGLNMDVPQFGDIKPVLALFDVATGQQIAVLPVSGGINYFASAIFSPDDKQFIAASGKEVRTWDVAARRETSRQTAKGAPNNSFAEIVLAPDGAHFLVNWTALSGASRISYVGAEMRDASSSHVQWKMPTGVSPRFDFSPDGSQIFSSDQSSLFEMRDARSGRILWKKTLANGGFNERQWLPDSSAIAIDMDDALEMWDAKTGAVVRSIPYGEMQSFVFAPDGSQIYMIDFGGKIWSQRLR